MGVGRRLLIHEKVQYTIATFSIWRIQIGFGLAWRQGVVELLLNGLHV